MIVLRNAIAILAGLTQFLFVQLLGITTMAHKLTPAAGDFFAGGGSIEPSPSLESAHPNLPPQLNPAVL